MKMHESDGVPYYSFPMLEAWPELTQAAFTRQGGVSEPPYDSLNVSFTVLDDAARVGANRERLARVLGWDPARLVAAHQVHGREVAAVGRDRIGATILPKVDGLVTDEPGVLLLMKFADCVPVVLWDPVRRVVALAHAGWKGTLLGTPAAAVELMVQRYGCHPSDLLAGLGPSIGPCCYEVGPEVAAQAEHAFPGVGVLELDLDGSTRLDLWGANAETLMRAGVAEENVAVAGICTRCRKDLFFSHRAAGGLTGRFAVVAGMRDDG